MLSWQPGHLSKRANNAKIKISDPKLVKDEVLHGGFWQNAAYIHGNTKITFSNMATGLHIAIATTTYIKTQN